ncbi:MAG: hypothetical protein AAGH15_12310 [Myxococcota bacterium]
MTTSDLSVKILQEIRDELKRSRSEHGTALRGLRSELREELQTFRAEHGARTAVVDQRFEVIETSLRDMAGQLVMLSRGMTVLLEGRGDTAGRLNDLERRLDVLETERS